MADKISVKGRLYDEHKDWPKLKKQVDAAFKVLKKKDLYVDTDVVGTENDATMEIIDSIDSSKSSAIVDGKDFSCKGYVFYCDSAVREARLSDPNDLSLYINIGSYDGEGDPFEEDPVALKKVSDIVVETLTAEGLKAEASEAEPTYIFVSLK